jgi:hypothetical protein
VLSVCVWALLVSRDGFTLKGGIGSSDQKLVEKPRSHTHKPGAEGEFGWLTTSSITVGHTSCHRWARWWARRGTGSLSADCCYSNLLKLLRVKTRVCSYSLYTTPFLSYPSQLTLVKLISYTLRQTLLGQGHSSLSLLSGNLLEGCLVLLGRWISCGAKLFSSVPFQNNQTAVLGGPFPHGSSWTIAPLVFHCGFLAHWDLLSLWSIRGVLILFAPSGLSANGLFIPSRFNLLCCTKSFPTMLPPSCCVVN